MPIPIPARQQQKVFSKNLDHNKPMPTENYYVPTEEAIQFSSGKKDSVNLLEG